MDGASIRKLYDDAASDTSTAAPSFSTGAAIRDAFDAAEPVPPPPTPPPNVPLAGLGAPEPQVSPQIGNAVIDYLFGSGRTARLQAPISGSDILGMAAPGIKVVGASAVENPLARGAGAVRSFDEAANALLPPPPPVRPIVQTPPETAPVAAGNALAPQPPVAAPANPLAPALSPAVSEPPSVETPTEAPKAKILPIRTPAQADAEADRILRHFAGNGNTTIDTSAAVPGSRPTLSQAIVGGNPGIAGLERAVRDSSPNDFVALEQANQAARADHLASITGTPADLAAAEAERDAATAKARAAAFSSPQPTDPTPVIQTIDKILASGQGQRDAVANALNDVRAKLVDKDGNLQTDPEQLYGIRQHINDIISPKAAGTAKDARAAARELMTVKDALDPVIEQGAPGFTNYIRQYEELSKPINGMQYLQSLNLTDAQGKIQLGKLNTAINGLERQQKLPGARLADSVTDEQLEQLKALREDFRRDAKQQLGKSLGSDTHQRLGNSSALSVLNHPIVGATGVVGAVTNPFVAVPLVAGRLGLQKLGTRGQAMVMESLRRKLLNPELAASAFRPKE